MHREKHEFLRDSVPLCYKLQWMSIQFEAAVPTFTVPDVVRTAEYYRDVLGFTIAGYWGKPPVFAIVWRGPVEFFFSSADPSEVRTGNKFAFDAYVRVTDVDALAEELKQTGAEMIEGPVNREYNQRELTIKDCNGIILCFGEEIEHRE